MSIGPWIAIAAYASAAAIAHAQPGGVRPDPADPAAATPPVHHRSSFDGYRRDAEPRIEPWRASNDRVRDVGGWRIYAREVDEGARGAAASDSATPAPASAGHAHEPRGTR
jgi:hypothetical protein